MPKQGPCRLDRSTKAGLRTGAIRLACAQVALAVFIPSPHRLSLEVGSLQKGTSLEQVEGKKSVS